MSTLLPGLVPDSQPAGNPRVRGALFEILFRSSAHSARWTLWVIAALFALLGLWALVAKLDIVAVAPGRLVPQGYLKTVQPAVAGIVRELLVREGDAVGAGQVLVRLDPTETKADREAIERELALRKIQLRRIDAELQQQPLEPQNGDDPELFAPAVAQYRARREAHLHARTQQRAAQGRSEKELAAAREMVRKLEMTLPSHERSAQAYESLAARNLVGVLQSEEVRRAAIENRQNLQAGRATVAGLEAAVSESAQRLALLSSEYQSQLQTERVQTISTIGQLEQQRIKVDYQQRNLELRAPQAGRVKTLATTTLGAVVQPGTVLLSLVPRYEPLLAEVMIENQDIGFVRPGHAVRLKFATYPFQRYGTLAGVVKTVIADSQAQELHAPGGQASEKTESGVASSLSFKATIELADQVLIANGVRLPLAAGMELSAEIIEGQRTVLQYLLSPLRRVISEAGMER